MVWGRRQRPPPTTVPRLSPRSEQPGPPRLCANTELKGLLMARPASGWAVPLLTRMLLPWALTGTPCREASVPRVRAASAAAAGCNVLSLGKDAR